MLWYVVDKHQYASALVNVLEEKCLLASLKVGIDGFQGALLSPG